MARDGDGLYVREQTWYLDCRLNGVRHVIRLGKHIPDTRQRRLPKSSAGRFSRVKRGSGNRRIQAGARVRANCELAVFKSLFNRCRERQLFEGDNPVASVKQRFRFLEPEEADSEALTLRWNDVDMACRTLTVAAAYAKSGTSRTVSLRIL
jgi:integrase